MKHTLFAVANSAGSVLTLLILVAFFALVLVPLGGFLIRHWTDGKMQKRRASIRAAQAPSVS